MSWLSSRVMAVWREYGILYQNVYCSQAQPLKLYIIKHDDVKLQNISISRIYNKIWANKFMQKSSTEVFSWLWLLFMVVENASWHNLIIWPALHNKTRIGHFFVIYLNISKLYFISRLNLRHPLASSIISLNSTAQHQTPLPPSCSC